MYLVKLPIKQFVGDQDTIELDVKKMNEVKGVNIKVTYFFVILVFVIFVYNMILVEKYKLSHL